MRKKNEAGSTSGARQPMTVKLNTTQVARLEAELATQQERLQQQRDALQSATDILAAAKRAYDKSESLFYAGRMDAGALGKARTQHEAAKKQHAIARVAFDECDRAVNTVLPAAIQEARNAALAQLRDTLRTETQAKAQALAALLEQAKVLSDDLRLLQDAAVAHFSPSEMIRLKVSLIGCMDLGEEHGYVSPRAGIPNLACGWLTGQSLQQPTLFDVWLGELASYLEHTPAEMAAADKLNRVTHIANDKRRYAEALVREAAQKRLEAMMEARGGGALPRGTVVE